MSTKVLGVGRGESGTRVESTDQARSIVPSPLGVSGLVGAYEWGPTNEAVVHTGKSNYVEVRGAAIREDPTAVVAEHWYQAARGAGQLVTLRLVDGDEAQSSRDVYARDIEEFREFIAPTALHTNVLTLQGRYPGRRGGQVANLSGYHANLATGFNATAGTFATGVTMLTDVWRDTVLGFTGVARTYAVTANSVAGILSIDVPTGDAGPTGAGYWYIVLAATRFDGQDYGLAFGIDNSQQRPGTETKLAIYDRFASGRRAVKTWQSVGFDTALGSYVEQIITREANDNLQHLVTATATPPPDTTQDEYRPANYAALVHPDSGITNVLTLVTHNWARVSPGGGDARIDPTTVAYGAQPLRVRAVATFTAATTADVVFSTWEGAAISGTYTTGTDGLTLGALFAPGVPWLPSFSLFAGLNAMAATDTITIWFNPLPLGLETLNGVLYPHAHDQGSGANNIRTSFVVRSNTATTVTLASATDLGVDHTLVASGMPTITSTIPGTYNLAGGETFIYQIGTEPAVTLTQTLVGAAVTTAALIVELTTQEIATNPVPRVRFTVSATDSVTVECLHDYGVGSLLTVTTGTLNAIIGIINATNDAGTDGTVVALSFMEGLTGGLDGVATLGNDNEYIDAWDISGSPLNTLLDQNHGFVRYAMPGVNVAAAQNAATVWVAANGHGFRGEFPASITDEDAAADWKTTNLTGDENIAMAFDSLGYPARRPFVGEEALYPTSGAIMGMEARLAAQFKGYHVAAAGEKADIGDVFYRLLSDDSFTQAAPKKATGLLNSAGIQAVNHVGAAIFVFGDRNPADAYAGTVWKHMVEARLHIMHTLERLGDPYVFEDLGLESRAALASAIRFTMRQLYDRGWFARTETSTFENTVLISVGDDVNSAAVQSVGELRALVDIPGGIVGTAERVVFALGTGGVAVTEEL